MYILLIAQKALVLGLFKVVAIFFENGFSFLVSLELLHIFFKLKFWFLVSSNLLQFCLKVDSSFWFF
jgi:hypothetical protein